MPFDNSFLGSDSPFKGCYTIDPSKGAEAWERLSANQLGLEIGMLPKSLHESLLEALDAALNKRPLGATNQGAQIERE